LKEKFQMIKILYLIYFPIITSFVNVCASLKTFVLSDEIFSAFFQASLSRSTAAS